MSEINTSLDPGPYLLSLVSLRAGEHTGTGIHGGGAKKNALWSIESRIGRGCMSAANATDRLLHQKETYARTLSDATCPKQVDEILHRDLPASFLFRMVSMVASDTATCA